MTTDLAITAFTQIRPQEHQEADLLTEGKDTEASRLEIKEADLLPVLGLVWDDLGFSEVVDQVVAHDEQVGLSPGQMVKGMVLNVLSGRDPLYRVESFFQRVPIEALLGSGVTAIQFNDTALARHLDRIASTGGSALYASLSLRAIARDGLALDQLHSDTTSKLVFGEYRNRGGEEECTLVTRGHSKDHRPDLKQVMFGVSTTRDGVPVFGEVLPGNTSDKTWHYDLLEVIQSYLHLPEGKSIIYVGDSALITQDNLDTAAHRNITLVGRLPRTVKICGELVARALARPEAWKNIGSVSPGKTAARYEVQSFQEEVLGHRVNLAVCRSSEPNERVRKSIERRQRKAHDRVAAMARLESLKTFACEEDAQRAREGFIAKNYESLVRTDVRVVAEQQPVKRRGPGRPRKDEVKQVNTVFRLAITFANDEAAAEQARVEESCFVLVHTGKDRVEAREILEKYKNQAVVETRFPFLKDAQLADVFFIKDPDRLEALGYVIMIALLVWCLWERRVRRNLTASGESPLRDTTGFTKAHPTAMVCRHIMRGVKVVRVRHGQGGGAWSLAEPLSPEQQRVVRFSRSPVTALLLPLPLPQLGESAGGLSRLDPTLRFT